MGKEDSSMGLVQPVLDFNEKQVREALLGMGLPKESVEQAMKKIHEFEGDLNGIASYALSLSSPQAECIEEHLSDDMISSDEEVPDSKDEWMDWPLSRQAQSSQAQAVSEEAWVDPICKIFQSPPNAENLAYNESGSSRSSAAGETSLVPVPPGETSLVAVRATMVNPSVPEQAEAGCSYQFSLDETTSAKLDHTTPLSSPAPPLQSPQQREKYFLDMGFPLHLVTHAFRHHGSEVDDSIVVQFLIDNNKEDHAPQIAQPKIYEEADDSDSDEEIVKRSVRQIVANRSLKHGKASKSYRLPDCSDSENEEGSLPEFVQPTPLCSREAPEKGGHKAVMLSLGFSPDLIERAVLELGEGVEYDMLLEYLLYLSAQQDPGASSSSGPSRGGEDNTLEKFTAEFQFPSVAVEKAMSICRTPLWNASQEQIMDLVDFLAAHMEDLIMGDDLRGNINLPDSDDSEPDSDDEENSVWGEDGLFGDASYWNQGGKGKRKHDERGRAVANMELCPKAGRPKGVVGASRLKKSTSSISKCKATTPSAAIPTVNKQRGAIGFGLPGQPMVKRFLKEDVKGAPFFYFENVAGMPVGEWRRIQMHLFDIEPEFVDAMHFSACRRSRGYIHNLPIEGRKKIIKDPPMTIMDLMPQTKPFWPEWDKRTKLNCINTVKASEYLSKRLGVKDGTAIQKLDLSPEQQKVYMKWCCKLNLVWTSPSLPSPVEANEIEAMLGFDKDHSRHCFNYSTRYKALGNSFSVFTVAYHFSVLKPLYPKGIKVLSLFSGIGGAEVALHKVGIQLNVVVSVEIDEGARRCLQTWWALTNQRGILNLEYHDVQLLTRDVLASLVDKYRGFDFIVGGSPCNNFTGNNRVSRVGLDGQHSTMFFEFSRIVSTVRELTINYHGR